jgi:adenosylmethionine-8-amino-7-oxononanoate aminotransferase
LGAVSFKPELLADHADLPLRTFVAAKERGVLVRPLGDGVAISPSLVTTEKDLVDASAALADALGAVASSL